MTITLIAAMDRNRGIGIQNTLPWKISEDLKHFKEKTLNKPIIMGRKTFDSIGRPLPKRHNIVITRNPAIVRHPEVSYMLSADTAISYIRNHDDVFVIGGAQIYQEFLPIADRLILTEIDHDFKCDAFFPEFDRSQWFERSRITNILNCPFVFHFVEYDRIK